MAEIMDNMLKSRAGSNETIRVVFKKTINIAQYETEVIEADTSVDVPCGITGIERMIISHILFSELEYEVLLRLVIKGVVSKQDMDKAVDKSEHGLKLLYAKAESLGVKPAVEKYINGMNWSDNSLGKEENL